MKIVLLTQGKVAQVDDEDFARINAHQWCVIKKTLKNRTVWYAMRQTRLNGKRHAVYMHRVILGVTDSTQVDHRFGDTLNNQRSNLRVATNQQNQYNMRKAPHGTSKFKGVSWDTRAGKWRACIHIGGKHKHLGYFTDETQAAGAYDSEAKQHYGEFALTNSMLDSLRPARANKEGAKWEVTLKAKAV